LLAVTSFVVVWRLASRQPAPVGGGEATTVAGALGPAPHFQLASLDGRRLGPGDFAGKVVLLDFWATWCGPCHIQADVLRDLYPRFRGPRVEFLAVSVGEDLDTVRHFVAEKPFDYPVLLDPQSEVADPLGVMALPTIMVVDRQGRLVFRESGLVAGETLEQVLRDAGAG
jgi:peroxiredoxin